jgi:hypothetical protein
LKFSRIFLRGVAKTALSRLNIAGQMCNYFSTNFS